MPYFVLKELNYVCLKNNLRYLESGKLKELLNKIPSKCLVSVNQVGNLLIFDDQKVVYCYIDIVSESIEYFDDLDD